MYVVGNASNHTKLQAIYIHGKLSKLVVAPDALVYPEGHEEGTQSMQHRNRNHILSNHKHALSAV